MLLSLYGNLKEYMDSFNNRIKQWLYPYLLNTAKYCCRVIYTYTHT
jgi:hypothetical protein